MMKKFFSSTADDRFKEIVFEHRNKAYGAYSLRTQEASILQKSLLYGIALVAAVSLTPMAINAFKNVPVDTGEIGPRHVFVNVQTEDPQIPPVIKAESRKNETATSVIDPRNVTPRRDAVEKIPAKDNMPSSSTDNPGSADPAGSSDPAVGPADNGTVADPVLPVVPAVKPVVPVIDNSPKIKVDKEAEFAGGLDAFRSNIMKNLDPSIFESESGRLTATVTFIVEKNGTITAVTASGKDLSFNKEAEKAVRSVKGMWKPAKIAGEAVRSYYKVPITIQFE